MRYNRQIKTIQKILIKIRMDKLNYKIQGTFFYFTKRYAQLGNDSQF